MKAIGPELESLRESAEHLERQLRRNQEVVAPLDARIAALEQTATRLEASIERVIDRIPGLSVEKAREGAEA